jgi:hypothetical protein
MGRRPGLFDLRSREEYSKGVAEDQSRVLVLDEQATVRWPRGAVGT